MDRASVMVSGVRVVALGVLAGTLGAAQPAAPASGQPAGQPVARTTQPPPVVSPPAPAPERKKKEKVIDPDMLFHLGVTAGRVKGSEFGDDTGKGRGSILGNPMSTNMGPGGGFRFDGKGDWLEVSEATRGAIMPTRDVTIAAWVNLEALTKSGGIFGCIQDNGNDESGFSLGYTDDAFTFALATKGTNKLTYLKGAPGIKPGMWYHVVGTYDGRSMKLFVNGEQQAESKEQSGDILIPSKGVCTVACYKDDDEKHLMQGTLLEVKVLKRAFTPQQVTEEFVPGVRLTSYKPEFEATQRWVVKPYLQFGTQDGMTIMWETARPSRGVVEYGDRLPYTMTSSESSQGTLHEVRLTGLQPGSNYFYRVRTVADDGTELLSDDLTFQTALGPDAAWSFAVIGDTQKNKPVIEKLQTFAFTLRPNIQIHLGDVVDKGPDKDEWTNELLQASYPLLSRVCLYPSIGNHEDNHSNYYQYFSLPAPECWYTYTYGNAQFFSIDTNKSLAPESEQYKWLDRELGASKATWKFVYHHHPVYSSDEDDYGDTYKEPSVLGERRLRDLCTLLEKHHVDIDFNGHIHSYERSWPVYQGKVDEARGVRYITSGGGGGGLESAGPIRSWFAQRVYRGHHMCILTLHDKTLQMQVFDLEGRLIDQMDVRKP